MRALGAELVFHGRDFDDAREHCEKLAAEHGYRYVHSANEPALLAGVATESLEILESSPDIDAIVVPVGGGSGVRGLPHGQGDPALDPGHRRPGRGGASGVPVWRAGC